MIHEKFNISSSDRVKIVFLCVCHNGHQLLELATTLKYFTPCMLTNVTDSRMPTKNCSCCKVESCTSPVQLFSYRDQIMIRLVGENFI